MLCCGMCFKDFNHREDLLIYYRARARHLTAQHLTLLVAVSTQWNGKILHPLLKIILTPTIRTSSAIKIWYFPHTAIPSDITSGSPNPNGWELPQANFAGGCNIDSQFISHQIVFDITFCGDWAGDVWSTTSSWYVGEFDPWIE